MKNAEITRDGFRHWITIEVRWGDMDSQGHVNNAVYFTYCESARVSLFGRLGFRGRLGDNHGPSLVSASCDFARQVVYPATLDVGACVRDIGRRSFRMEYGIFRHGTDELVATGSSVTAWTDYQSNRAIPIPDELRAELEKYRWQT